MEIVLRPYSPADKNLVYSTMLRGLYYGSEFFGKIDKPAFFDFYSRFLDVLIPLNRLTVACLADDPDVVLGWALYSAPGGANALHYVFVKTAFRRQGIAKRLLENVPIAAVSHLTELGDAIRLNKGIKFNPFLQE